MQCVLRSCGKGFAALPLWIVGACGEPILHVLPGHPACWCIFQDTCLNYAFAAVPLRQQTHLDAGLLPLPLVCFHP